MTTEQVTHYRDLSAEHLRLAQALLAEGDPMEALERGWGAIETALKEAAEARGLPCDGHRDFWQVVRTVRHETGDSELGLDFGAAQTMHINFYDVPYERDDIEWYLDQVERLVGKLERLAR